MAWGTVAAIAAPIVAGQLLGGKKKTEQVPLETPEQRAARQKLMNFADTGQFGDFKAGAEVPVGYGDFNTTGIEQEGLSSLQQLLSSQLPEQFSMGNAALRDVLDTSPAAIDAQFSPFKAQVDRQMREADINLRRNAGFAGNLYSTDTIRRLGDVQARGNDTMTAELARLTDQALQRRAAAIPLAYQAGESQEGLRMGRVDASQRYGGLTRQLNDAAIKARDAELLRRRKELQLPIDAAMTVAGTPAQYGVPSVETSPYQELLGLAGQVGGQYLGNELYLDQYKRKFPSAQPPMRPQ